VRLRHLQGWSLQEIASQFDRTPSAAAGLIKRGLEAIRNEMHDCGLM
jgi:DNA-directed RNA polymerase specialized sigma24 family protein